MNRGERNGSAGRGKWQKGCWGKSTDIEYNNKSIAITSLNSTQNPPFAAQQVVEFSNTASYDWFYQLMVQFSPSKSELLTSQVSSGYAPPGVYVPAVDSQISPTLYSMPKSQEADYG
jgi:hypothetical protein